MRLGGFIFVLSTSAGLALAIVSCGTGRPGAAATGDTIGLGAESCANEGETRSCSVIVHQSAGVRTCASGTQTCTSSGYWSLCTLNGSPPVLQSINLNPETNGGLRPLNVNPLGEGGVACSNPCSPNCIGANEACRPDGSADGSTVCIPPATTISVDSTPTPGTVPGFEKKVAADQCQNTGDVNARPCEVSPFSPTATDVDNGRMASTCQADYFCEPTAGLAGPGCCKRFLGGETHATKPSGGLDCVGALPDLTLAGSCSAGGTGGSANTVISICNRGNAPAIGPIWVGWAGDTNIPWNGGTLAAETCLGAPTVTYTCRFDGTIVPGGCRNISKFGALGAGCAGSFPTGNTVVVVNNPGAMNRIAECDLDVKDAVNAVQPTQPGCANNLTAFNTNSLPLCAPSYTTLTITETYTARCGAGQVPRWEHLGWDGDTPSQGGTRSTIEFRARTRNNLVDGGAGPWVGPTLAGKAWNNPDTSIYVEGPSVCRPDVPTVNPDCPKKFDRSLTAAQVTSSTLELEIRLIPVVGTFGGQLVPILRNWWASYKCVDAE